MCRCVTHARDRSPLARRAAASAHIARIAATQSAGRDTIFAPDSSGRINPLHATGEHTTAFPIAAASRNLFLIPPPLTNGSTTT